MGNFFKKRWVTIVSILFICFMAYASASYASDICCVCQEGPTWVETASTNMDDCIAACAAIGETPVAGPYIYNKRSDTSCGAECSNGESTCYKQQWLCWHPSTGTNKYNYCNQRINPRDFKCILEYADGSPNPNDWNSCPATTPVCNSHNWEWPGGYTWPSSSDSLCVESDPDYPSG